MIALEVPLWGLVPFVVLLGCMAVLPLIGATAHFWERNRHKLLVSLGLGLPTAAWVWLTLGGEPVAHALLEYAQFLTLLGTLFVISGGVFLAGDLRAAPRTNTLFLATGAVLASFIGTTGAAMLLIRPLLNTNKERHRTVHTVVFTILIVANAGGLLTPLGDPPLFLGMLRGVPFTWTFQLWPQWLFTNALLLLSYYALDRKAFAEEAQGDVDLDARLAEPLRIRGWSNIALLGVVVLAVALLPSVHLGGEHHGWASLVPWRELVMLAAGAASYLLTSKQVRFGDNEFTWDPILEVAALFIGIFLTMVPALKYLAEVAPRLRLDEVTFFVFSGGLSSVLDNAPTYATFFEIASQLPGEPRVAGVPEPYLVAISLGSVLCGALTYIGNGPNFMVKAVAESRGVAMPSFGGYIGWTLRWLAPVLAAMVLLFLASPAWCQALGAALAVAIVARDLWIARAHRVTSDTAS